MTYMYPSNNDLPLFKLTLLIMHLLFLFLTEDNYFIINNLPNNLIIAFNLIILIKFDNF